LLFDLTQFRLQLLPRKCLLDLGLMSWKEWPVESNCRVRTASACYANISSPPRLRWLPQDGVDFDAVGIAWQYRWGGGLW